MVDVVAAAYKEWRQHHLECSVCGEHDYFDPGMPHIAKAGEVPSKTIIPEKGPHKGKEVGICWSADTSLLCLEGKLLFSAWVKATMQHPLPTSRL